MARALAALSPWLALRPGASFVQPRGGPARVRSSDGDVTLGALPKATVSALRLLKGRGAPEDAVLSCGTVSTQLLTFCKNPTATAIAVGIEDGRIGQRVK